jgi:hypothetical protein
MSAGEKLKVSFEGPRHGWLTISFVLGEDVFQFSVEHVPFDIVTELADGLHDLLCGHPSATARGNDGPIEYQLVSFPTREMSLLTGKIREGKNERS